jgi:hypothetical protein
MEAPDVSPANGHHEAAGIGLNILRTQDVFGTTNHSNVIVDGKPVTVEHHHYRGAFGHYTTRYKSTKIITHPMGYGIGDNEYHKLNSVCLKDQSWLNNREYLWSKHQGDWLITAGRMFGPSVMYQNSIPPYYWPNPDAYTGCEVITTIAINKVTGQTLVEDSWSCPGNTYPEQTIDLPVVQRCQFAPGPLEVIAPGLLRCATNGIAVHFKIEMAGAEPWIDIDSEPIFSSGINYWRFFVKSPTNLNKGKLRITSYMGDEYVSPPDLGVPTKMVSFNVILPTPPSEGIAGGVLKVLTSNGLQEHNTTPTQAKVGPFTANYLEHVRLEFCYVNAGGQLSRVPATLEYDMPTAPIDPDPVVYPPDPGPISIEIL